MSGGVDSSVAARLLLERGHEVIGVFMRHGQAEHSADSSLADQPDCCTAGDAEDARRVAEKAGIPFQVLDLQEEFRQIIDYFVAEYASGRTPNPCAACNRRLKFGKLFDYADSVGAEFLATGHHARVTRDADAETPALRSGLDAGKDQSYVLFGIHRSRLPRILLPVGEHRKAEIRRMAGELGLAVADKRDSQEICFVAPGAHAQFVRARRPGLDTSGEIVTTDGRVVGRHGGIEAFTIGQREGLGVAMGEPYFVLRIEADTRRIVIGRRDELARRKLTARDLNWLVDAPRSAFPCTAKIRYNSPAAAAVAEPLPEGRLRVVFDEPRYGVAPGQAVVCYHGDRVLGGGWIE
jgi:tRNA-specific 2-thiouridylase